MLHQKFFFILFSKVFGYNKPRIIYSNDALPWRISMLTSLIGMIALIGVFSPVKASNNSVVYDHEEFELVGELENEVFSDSVPPIIFQVPWGIERMRITGEGNVGIGTPNPQEQLEISGNFRFPLTSIIMVDTNTLIHSFGESNFFAGLNAGNLTMTGVNNIAHGVSALGSMTDGSNNTAIGAYSLTTNTEGDNNTAIGSESLSTNLSGSSNTTIGADGMKANTLGSRNTAIGISALSSNSEGDNNTAIGGTAMLNNSEGFNNTAVGEKAMINNTTGVGNTAIGWNTLTANVTGYNNTVLGFNANVASNNLSNATAIGANTIVEASNSLALGSASSEVIKVGIGDGSPDGILEVRARGENHPFLVSSEEDSDGDFFIVTNEGQVGIGTPIPEKMLDVNGEMIVKDNNRIAVFQSSGVNSFISLENSNGTVGTSLGYFGSNVNEYFYIDLPTGGFGEMVILDNGNTGVGTQNPQFLLHVAGAAGKPGGGPWTAISDYRLKESVKPYQAGLKELLLINPVKYRYSERSGLPTSEDYIGVIAQEMETIAPYTISKKKLIEGSDQDFLVFDPNALTYILINAVKEQQKMIEKQQNQIDQLIQRLDNN